MVKILVDATPIRDKPSGIGIYTINLIKALYSSQIEDNYQLSLYYQLGVKKCLTGDFTLPKILKEYTSCHTIPLPVTVANLLGKYYPLLVNYFDKYLDSPSIIQGTDHFVYPCRDALKIMTIHDLSFIKYPEYAPKIVKKTYKDRIKNCLQWTDLIITFSQSTKQDIMEMFTFPEDKIFITHQASRYENLPINLSQIHPINYNSNNPYLLFVSTFEPRKNIINIIQAFNYLKKTKKIAHNLILIGQKGWQYQSIFKAINNSPFREHIRYLGYLSDQEVALFYHNAEVFVYPSYYEGFGLPVLEAMSLGVPVITSNTSSLPEVAGDAAILINPDNYQELADAILQVINNTQLRNQLIEKGKNRAKLFSWQNTAKQTINAYKYLLDQ
jgi:glycosyltransferase involved in cell wall biosynthesis